MGIKVVYRKGILKPLEPINLKEGEQLEIELKKRTARETYSASKVDDRIIEDIIESTESGE
jgi:predicted DNA-binding antitoxin AbrB/MazE fold protein